MARPPPVEERVGGRWRTKRCRTSSIDWPVLFHDCWCTRALCAERVASTCFFPHALSLLCVVFGSNNSVVSVLERCGLRVTGRAGCVDTNVIFDFRFSCRFICRLPILRVSCPESQHVRAVRNPWRSSVCYRRIVVARGHDTRGVQDLSAFETSICWLSIASMIRYDGSETIQFVRHSRKQ